MKAYLKSARATLLLVAVLCVVILGVSIVTHDRAFAQSVPEPIEIATALTRTGLHPEALTAAGASQNDVTGVVQEMVTYLTEHPGQLELVDLIYADATREADSLKRRIQAGIATEQEVAAYPAVQATLASARTQRAAVIDDMLDAAAAGLTTSERGILNQVRLNRSWALPGEFLVIAQTQEDWVTLRNALAHERIRTGQGETPDPAAAAHLQRIRGIPAVAAARANLDANLSLITATWENAIGL